MNPEVDRGIPIFHVQCVTDNDATRAIVHGELDLDTGPQLVSALTGALAGQAPKSVVIDLHATAFVDSSGLRALLDCRRAADDRGAAYQLCVAPGQVSRLLQVAGLTDYFDYVAPVP